MTEWEQLKSEYKGIPIPSDGPHQMLKAMTDARRKRNRWKRLTQYGTVAAAVLLIVVLLPRLMLFSGEFDDMAQENISMSADAVAESTASDGWFAKGSARNENMAPATNNAPASEGFYEGMLNAGGNDNITEAPRDNLTDVVESDRSTEEKKNITESMFFGAEIRKAISAEILRQMEERMLKTGETYYIKSKTYPQGFEEITEEQEFYIDETGLLVVVFEAGTVAPEEQGHIEFVIPVEIFLP